MIRNYGALAAYLADRRAMPMRWGSRANDCASYADGAWVAQGGKSILREMRLRWRTARGAMRVLNRVGSLAAILDASSQLRRVPVGQAMRGDLGLVMGEHGPFVVVVDGEMVTGPTERGAAVMSRDLLLTAWGPV